ncbi:MAG: undecaprenyl-diphosphate phosphatase [Eubacterium sp.]|nr:undecaprenyl-diphosphate phosphatase [Eubacterium sp.]MDE6154832.1 undecaprenyl-diphosphate phosphatase [Eubacterium sp.]MDE6766602.1 undecaprenyl-diphosphate phosphatase [Eubacterium sp.]
MWILTAIFQAIGQALSWIFPISESGHSAIFHDFAGRFTNACSQLTGVIHIGIAVGIIAAFYKLFLQLAKNFFGGWNDLFHKRLDVKKSSPQRKFMYMTILSFAPMIFYAIPAGKYGNVYSVFHRMSYNGNLLGEGICIALTGALLIVTASMLDKNNKPIPPVLQAIIIGIIAFLAVPTSGASLIAGVFCVAVILGMSDKYALRYSMVLSTMVLFVMGIVEICVGVTKISIVSAVIGFIISAVITYLAVKVLIFVIKNKALKYFAWYDIVLGVLCAVIGIFEIVIK